MKNSARLFNCVHCQRQVIICSHCDHGNIYCSHECSQAARKESLRAANQRYQNTRQGKFNHAERQRRYRLYQKKVTYHSSQNTAGNDLLHIEAKSKLIKHEITNRSGGIYCHFCGRCCDSLVRVKKFLVQDKTPIHSFFALGP